MAFGVGALGDLVASCLAFLLPVGALGDLDLGGLVFPFWYSGEPFWHLVFFWHLGGSNDFVKISESKTVGDAFKVTAETSSDEEPTPKATSEDDALNGSVGSAGDTYGHVEAISNDVVNKVCDDKVVSMDDADKAEGCPPEGVTNGKGHCLLSGGASPIQAVVEAARYPPEPTRQTIMPGIACTPIIANGDLAICWQPWQASRMRTSQCWGQRFIQVWPYQGAKS